MKLIFILFSCLVLHHSLFAQTDNLSYFLSQALANSPLLKDYQNQIQSNAYDSMLLQATYKPQVTGSSYALYPPVIKGYGYDEAITNGGSYNALIGVNKTLINKKNSAAQFRDIRLQSQSIDNTSKISEQELKRSIVSQYIITYGDQLQLEFNNEINSLLIKEDSIFKKLTEKNIYRQVDYLSFLVTLQQQQFQAQQLKLQFTSDYTTLKFLCGITDTVIQNLQSPDISLQALPEISNSVFFEKFMIDSLKLANSKDLIDINYRPKINIFADAGYNSTLAYKAYRNFGTSFGISAVVPIYDGKQKKLQYSKITLAERTRTFYESFFTSQYRQQIAQLTEQLHATDDMLNNINKQLKYSQALIEVNEKLLETGDVKAADYILAINNYLNIKNLITQNSIARLQIINQLNYWNR